MVMFVERGGQPASVREIAFILADAPGLTEALETLGPEVAVVVVDAFGDGLQAIAAALASRRGLAAVHIVAWGEQGVLHLGRLSLAVRSLGARAACVAALGAALADTGEIRLHDAEIAAGDEGAAFLAAFAAVSGVRVSTVAEAAPRLPLAA